MVRFSGVKDNTAITGINANASLEEAGKLMADISNELSQRIETEIRPLVEELSGNVNQIGSVGAAPDVPGGAPLPDHPSWKQSERSLISFSAPQTNSSITSWKSGMKGPVEEAGPGW